MPLGIERVGAKSDTVLRNLYEHYVHDMSEWLGWTCAPTARSGRAPE